METVDVIVKSKNYIDLYSLGMCLGFRFSLYKFLVNLSGYRRRFVKGH